MSVFHMHGQEQIQTLYSTAFDMTDRYTHVHYQQTASHIQSEQNTTPSLHQTSFTPAFQQILNIITSAMDCF